MKGFCNVISQPALSSPFFSRPGLLNATDPGYPWLADSWPTTSLPVNSNSGGPNDLSNFSRGGESSRHVLVAQRRRPYQVTDDGLVFVSAPVVCHVHMSI